MAPSLSLGATFSSFSWSEKSRAGHGGAANKERKNLAAAWNWGIKHLDLPERNPFLQIDPFPCDQREKYVPPLDDVYKVIEAAKIGRASCRERV